MKTRTRHRRPEPAKRALGQTIKVVVWREGGSLLGYLQDYPDYWTQGKTRKDLDEHLKDLYQDITSGEIPDIRKVEDLVIS